MAFKRDGKQYIWPFVVLGIVVIAFVPWLLNMFGVPMGLDLENPAVKYLLLKWLPTLGNALIVALLVIWFGAPAIRKTVAERKETVERDIKEASEVKRLAEEQYREVEEKLEKIDVEVKQLKTSYMQAAKEECDRISADTERQSERIEKDADTIFELQSNVAKHLLEREVMNRALDRARTEIVQKISSDSGLRDRLIDQGIENLNLSV